MAVASTDISTVVLDGKRYTTLTVTQDETTVVADEFEIAIPDFCTITLLEETLLGPAGAVTTRPAFGVVAAFVVDGDGYVDRASAANLTHRIAQNKRVSARSGALFYRSGPDVDLVAGQSIVTRITLVWGQHV